MQNISWEAPEFKAHKKGPRWYIVFAVISLTLLVYAISTRSPMTIITFLLGIGVVYLFAIKVPKMASYRVTGLGVVINDSLIPYKNIRKFWIIYQPPETKTLNFETTGYLNNTVSLELGNQDPLAIKFYLQKYLPEDLEMDETVTDILARKAKF